MAPFEAGGEIYNKAALEEHRAKIIELRDAALAQADFVWSVILSHNIAILAKLIEEVES
jgi:hypothetical protein